MGDAHQNFIRHEIDQTHYKKAVLGGGSGHKWPQSNSAIYTAKGT
jgi:hypothetical protein